MNLPDGTIFNMPIFSWGNTKKYLTHIVAVLHVIRQKGHNMQCRKFRKAAAKLIGMFKDLLKAAGSKMTVLLDMTWRPASWRSRRPRRCSKKPRSSTARQLHDVQAPEEPPVWWPAVPMGSHLPWDVQAWLVGWSKWSSDRREASTHVGRFMRLSWAA